jgi:DNA polymerase
MSNIKYMVIDIESRSELDLKEVGTTRYAQHPSTDILVVSLSVNGIGPFSVRARERVSDFKLLQPGQLPALDFSDFLQAQHTGFDFYVAHNATFERLMWRHILTERYGWPVIEDMRWYCTQTAGVIAGLPPSLDKMTKCLDMDHQKDSEGHALMLKMCKPRNAKKGPRWLQDEKSLQRLALYCERDVAATVGLFRALPKLTTKARRHWCFTQKVNDRGVPVNLDMARALESIVADEKETGDTRLLELTEGRVTKTTQIASIKKEISSYGVGLKSLDKRILKTLDLTTLPGPVQELIALRQEFGKASVAKIKRLKSKGGTADLIHDEMIDCGAGTGRWTCKGVQLHNVVRPLFERKEVERDLIPALLRGDLGFIRSMYGSPTLAAVSSMRSLIQAKPGKILHCADFAAIEARITFWLADEQKALDAYRKGRDIYKEMAARIFNVPYEEVTKEQRQLGKKSILGLGFGMAEDTFLISCDQDGIKITPHFSATVVRLYRSEYKRVAKMWRVFGSCIMKAVEHFGDLIDTGYKGIAFQCLNYHGKHWLFMTLPSGRRLWYPFPEIGENRFGSKSVLYWQEDPKTKQWVQSELYGAKAVENGVQAAAADLMYHGMLCAEAKGYRVVLSVHDEILTYDPEDFGSVPEIEKVLTTPTDWSSGLILAAEGYRSKYYGK